MSRKNEEKGIYLKCQNCGYVWEYKGNSEHYACCPRCQYKVPIEKQEINTGIKTEDE